MYHLIQQLLEAEGASEGGREGDIWKRGKMQEGRGVERGKESIYMREGEREGVLKEGEKVCSMAEDHMLYTTNLAKMAW